MPDTNKSDKEKRGPGRPRENKDLKAMWGDIDSIVRTATSGFNYMYDLVPALERLIPGYTFALVDPKQLDDALNSHWIVCQPKWFPGGVEGFNRTVAMRYGLVEKDGAVWCRSNILCIMPLELRQKILEAQAEQSEAKFTSSVQDASGPASLVGSRNVDTSFRERTGTVADLAEEQP